MSEEHVHEHEEAQAPMPPPNMAMPEGASHEAIALGRAYRVIDKLQQQIGSVVRANVEASCQLEDANAEIGQLRHALAVERGEAEPMPPQA